MKNFIFSGFLFLQCSFYTLILHGQPNIKVNIKEAWKAIDSLERMGFLQEAIVRLDQLQKNIDQTNQPFDWVRGHMYHARYLDLAEAEPESKGIYHLEEQLKIAEGVSQAVLQSSLAKYYFQYAMSNAYELQSRTSITAEWVDSIEYWTLPQFIKRSNELYASSLQRARDFDLIPLDSFSTLLPPLNKKEPLLENLYQVLLHRALTHYFNDQSRLTEPVYAFQVDQPGYFAVGEEFAAISLASSDSSSFLYKALQLFQREFNDISRYPGWMIHLEIMRLQALKSASNLENKEALYASAIQQLYDTWKKSPFSIEIAYHLAAHWVEQGEQYRALDPATYDFQALPARALELCHDALSTFPNAIGSTDLSRLISDITRSEWEWQSENYILPGQRNLVSIRYRNADQATVSLYKFSLDEWRSFYRMAIKTQREFIASKTVFRKETIKLQNLGDHQWHRTEYAMNSLDAGLYLVVLDSMPQEERLQGSAFSWIHVSSIEVVTRAAEKAVDVWVMDRKTSCPIKGAEIKVWYQFYNDYTPNMSGPEVFYTDKFGKVRIPVPKHARYEMVASTGDDFILPRDINKLNKDEIDDYDEILLFTDRVLYRPGQVVYVKGLCLRHSEKGFPKIVTRKKSTLSLMGPNGLEISKIQLTSNEFGSFNGSFTLPSGLLNGIFYISADDGSGFKSFNVEEYKRPRFFVKLDEPVSSYKLGDSITISGRADMYAGVAVGEATGTFRVTRTTYFPWLPWYRSIPEPGREVIVAQGSLLTNAQGIFTIPFATTIPAQNKTDLKPVYNYVVHVYITDATGETRSASKSISLGTTSLVPYIQKPKIVSDGKPDSLEIDIRNLSGKTQSLEAEIIISPIKAPGFRYQGRSWERPDIPQMSEQDFKKWFPSRPWSEEDKMQNWPKGSPIIKSKFNPASSKVVKLPAGFEAGLYQIELQFEDAGEKYTHLDWFVVHDTKKKRWADTGIPFHLHTDRQHYQPGDTAMAMVGNPWPEACIFISIEKDGKIVREGWQRVNGMHTFVIPIEETDRGAFFVHAFMVAFDGVHKKTIQINVPWSNKELRVVWETRRDNVNPGSKETWDFTISGADKNRGSYELLASMYDASLDAITGKPAWPSIPLPYVASRMSFSEDYRSYGKVSTLYWRPWKYIGSDWPRFIPDFSQEVAVPRRYSEIYSRADVMGGAGKRANAVPEAEMATMELNAPPVSDEKLDLSKTVNDESAQLQLLPRVNFNETAFFYPAMRTDTSGKIRFSFTMSDALTRWRLMLFAHDPHLASGYKEFMLETRKDLMVFPNVPRFVRQGDRIELAFKIHNNSEDQQSCQASIKVRDLVSGQDLTMVWIRDGHERSLALPSKESASWSPILQVAEDFSGLLEITYAARTDRHQDSEVHVVPVLSKQKLVTESVPLWVGEKGSRTFSLSDWKRKMQKETVSTQKVLLEFSPNPAWYALQALPYIMENPNPSTEQRVTRLYGNALGGNIMNKYPIVRSFLDSWQGEGTLRSALEKNVELKTAVLSETPWILEAVSETEQLERLKWLLDGNRLRQEYIQDVQQLKDMQLPSGAFPWFPGGRENGFITQYVIEKFGHLDKLAVEDIRASAELREILQKAIAFCDQEVIDYYNKYVGEKNQNDVFWRSLPLHYLYARSFFPELMMHTQLRKVYNYFLDQASAHFMQLSLQDQAYAALSLYRNMRVDEAKKIIRSGLERSVYSEEIGRFWKIDNAWNRNAQSMEVQTIWIEAVDEILGNVPIGSELRRWLLKQKQTTKWATTLETTRSIFVLLGTQKSWIEETSDIQIELNGEAWQPKTGSMSLGSGYFKSDLDINLLESAKPSITVKSASTIPGWGAVYWQYFADYEQIEKNAGTPLRLNRKLFRKVVTERGEELVAFNESDALKVGERLTVRLEWRVDRAMEFVHLKDVRASGLEPIDVQSGYYYNGVVGYYKAIRDQAVDFFFDYLSPGTYVLEYDMMAFHAGSFIAGVSTMQSMYAPEFTANTFGSKITIIK
jgi:uncharacterized protein YfaS (alpha-2-macroglobulin family)